MKKRLTFLIVIAFLAFGGFLYKNKAYAETKVYGVINSDTTWTLENSPYIITGNILVEEDVVLIIEPGVIVKFAKSPIEYSGYYIRIDGTLAAKGQDNQEVVFTSASSNPSPGDWGVIYFSDKSKGWDEESRTGSILDHCIIEYGGEGETEFARYTLVAISNTSPLIQNSTLRFSNHDSLHVNGDPKIINNTIDGGRILIGEGAPYFSGNDITGQWEGFYITGGFPIINKNNIIGNRGDIYGSGIRISGGKPVITYNNIINNSKSGIGITKCLDETTCSPTISNNNIYNNGRLAIGLFDCSRDIDVTNNWWGTQDPDLIEDLIYDQKNDYNLGQIIYNPFLLSTEAEAPAIGVLKLEFITQPRDITYGEPITGRRDFILVQIQDQFGNPFLITEYDITLELEKEEGENFSSLGILGSVTADNRSLASFYLDEILNTGTYRLKATTLALDLNRSVESEIFNINPKPITITASNHTKREGESDPEIYKKVIISDGSLIEGDTLRGSVVREVGERVGTYAIKQGTLTIDDGNEGNNYSLIFAPGTFTIEARPKSSGGSGGGGVSKTTTSITKTDEEVSEAGAKDKETIEKLQERVNQLTNQARSLINQLMREGRTLPPGAEKYSASIIQMQTDKISKIQRDLYLGTEGEDVKLVQNFLINQRKGPKSILLSNYGSTGYFGSITQSALAEYQESVNIKPSMGYFGFITRGYLKLIGY